jgi:protein-L-isoaspartate(D-aspartate) O-methyltransferase
MEDSFRHKGLRQKLVEELRQKGIRDERVLAAIGKVPRHVFMDSSFINYSYKDKAFPIGAGQTISQPYTVAFQTQLLDVQPGDKVLEVGTGSGYQAAILVEMGARVFTVERQKELYVKAMQLLPQLGYRPNFFFSDGTMGLPAYAPFDKIIVTAAAEEIPNTLIQQLKVGGRLVIPVGKRNAQQMMLVEKISESEFRTTSHGNFIFVPLLKGIEIK